MLQVLGNYARVRHYISLDPTSKKPMFEYHKQSLQHVKRILDEPEKRDIDLIGQSNIDLKLSKNSSFLDNMAGGVGFEPTTADLGGRCSVRHDYDNTQHHYFTEVMCPY